MARRHPFVLNARVVPSKWAINAVRGRLPAYDWEVVLRDLEQDCGDVKIVGVTTPVRSGRRQAKVIVDEPPPKDPIQALEDEIRMFHPELLVEEEDDERSAGSDPPEVQTPAGESGPEGAGNRREAGQDGQTEQAEDGEWAHLVPLGSWFGRLSAGNDVRGSGSEDLAVQLVPQPVAGWEGWGSSVADGGGPSQASAPDGDAMSGSEGRTRRDGNPRAVQSSRTPKSGTAGRKRPERPSGTPARPGRTAARSQTVKSPREVGSPGRSPQASLGNAQPHPPSDGSATVSTSGRGASRQVPAGEMETPQGKEAGTVPPSNLPHESPRNGEPVADAKLGVAGDIARPVWKPGLSRGTPQPARGVPEVASSGFGAGIPAPRGVRMDALKGADPWVALKDGTGPALPNLARPHSGDSRTASPPEAAEASPVSSSGNGPSVGRQPEWEWTGRTLGGAGVPGAAPSTPIQLGKRERAMEARVQTAVRRAREARERMRLWPRRTTRVYAVQGRGKPGPSEPGAVDDRT
jgi:hypothetical protein